MRRASVISALALGLLVSATGDARADDGLPLAVAVESADARLGAANVRRAVAQVLDVPIVSLLDADVERTRGTLAVVVARNGRSAQLFFQARAGRRQLTHVTAPAGERGASWIAVAVASFLRDSLRVDRWAIQSEVLDPFDGGMATPSPGNSEVIDPWAAEEDRRERQRRRESGSELGQPHPH